MAKNDTKAFSAGFLDQLLAGRDRQSLEYVVQVLLDVHAVELCGTQ